MQIHERLEKAWLAEGRFRTTYRTLTFTDQGLELGKGTLLVKYIQDEWDRRSLDIDGQEERILALLSVAWDHPMPDTILQHFHSASRALGKGEMVQAYIHLAFTGLQPLDHDSDNFRLLFIADGFLEAGVSGNEIRKAWGLGRSAYRKDGHDVSGEARDYHGRWVEDAIASYVGSRNDLRVYNVQTKTGVDSHAILLAEGNRLKGYVPDGDDPGVTVGMGFDVTQHSVQELRDLGFPESLVQKLSPYCSDNLDTGDTARAYLRSRPLQITEGEQSLINKVALEDITDRVSSSYDKWVANSPYREKTRFSDLPSEAQTAIVSIAYQYGPDFAHSPSPSARKVWRQLVRQNWAGAADTLVQWRQQQPGDVTRRRAEARWLASIKR